MKTPLLLPLLLFPVLVHGQTLDTSDFFTPTFTVRPVGQTSGLLDVTVTNTPATGSQSAGNVSWTHNAGGLVQSRVDVTVPIVGTVLANLDVQLAATTRTTGTSLIFGRRLSAEATLAGIPVLGQDGPLNNLITSVVDVGVANNWSSTVTLSGLAIVPDQLYQASFDVTTAAGLPVGLLTAAGFQIVTPGVTDDANQASALLNLLDIVTVGSTSSSGTVNVIFKSSAALSELEFAFSAASLADANALDGIPGDQNILTFSNMSITAVPEPGTAGLAMLSGIGCLLLFRRRTV
ncbi:MAG: hypothetical protein QM627_13640 [Luteolibacter sp.]